MRARSGQLQIRPEWSEASDDTSWSVLRLRGTNWAGFQSASGCVHELWRFNVSDYIGFLTRNEFNAVRLPLSGPILTWAANGQRWATRVGFDANLVSGRDYVVGERCGEYSGWTSLAVLDDIINRLRAAGIFVMLDMHTLDYPDGNTGDWCDFQVRASPKISHTSARVSPIHTTFAHPDVGDWCDFQTCDVIHEQLIFDAWEVLARRYCASPNVILADLFKCVTRGSNSVP